MNALYVFLRLPLCKQSLRVFLGLFTLGLLLLPRLAAQEPILGEMLDNLDESRLSAENPHRGQMQVYRILGLQLSNFHKYRAIEFELEPDTIAPPVSLMVYGEAAWLSQGKAPNKPRQQFQGKRLLTRGIAGKTLLRFHLRGNRASPLPRDGAAGAYSDISLPENSFPIYIVLYPFQKEAKENELHFRYKVRLIKNDFGFVRFRLQAPPNQATYL
ncbi:MAG: hypothetical protein AAF975_07160, partial [Spirochaetota bacterium]